MSSKSKYEPLSFSSLKAFSRSPLAFIEYKEGTRVETPAMRFGTLVHRAILEPERYETTTVVWEGTRRTKAYKEFEEANPNKDILTTKEALDIRVIANRVLEHPFAGQLVRDCDDYELKFQMEHLGVPHRGIIDGINGWFMLDLKTTQSVHPYNLQRNLYEMKYYMQAAIYQRAAQCLGRFLESYFVVCVESANPHHVQVVELEPHYIARGHQEWERLLERYKQWDGGPAHSHDDDNFIMMDAPGYAPPMDFP
jgi:hypothetical protein